MLFGEECLGYLAGGAVNNVLKFFMHIYTDIIVLIRNVLIHKTPIVSTDIEN